MGAKPQDTPQQGQAPPEPVAVSTSTVSSAGALSSCCCEHEVEHKAERRSTGEKKVSITKEVCTSSGCGATGITAIKDTVQDAPHEDTPREDPAAAALKPYADDSALLSPVLEETLNTDSPAKTAPEYPTAGHHHNHHHVSIAEPAPASQPTSMAGSSAEAHSSAGHPAAHSNYSIASNMSGMAFNTRQLCYPPDYYIVVLCLTCNLLLMAADDWFVPCQMLGPVVPCIPSCCITHEWDQSLAASVGLLYGTRVWLHRWDPPNLDRALADLVQPVLLPLACFAASEHSFLTDTAVGDAADLADEVSESVMKAAPSAAVSRMATKTYNESDSGARRSADSCDEHQQTSLDHSTLKVRVLWTYSSNMSCHMG